MWEIILGQNAALLIANLVEKLLIWWATLRSTDIERLAGFQVLRNAATITITGTVATRARAHTLLVLTIGQEVAFLVASTSLHLLILSTSSPTTNSERHSALRPAWQVAAVASIFATGV